MAKIYLKLIYQGFLTHLLHTPICLAAMLILYIPCLFAGFMLKSIYSPLGELSLLVLDFLLLAVTTGLWYLSGYNLTIPTLSASSASFFFLLPTALFFTISRFPLASYLPSFLFESFDTVADSLFTGDLSPHADSLNFIQFQFAPFLLLIALFSAFCLGYNHRPTCKLWLCLLFILSVNFFLPALYTMPGVSEYLLTILRLSAWALCGWVIAKEIRTKTPPPPLTAWQKRLLQNLSLFLPFKIASNSDNSSPDHP